MTQRNCHTRYPGSRSARTIPSYLYTLVMMGALLVGIDSSANNELAPATEDAAPIASEQSKNDKQCTWACQRWTKLCNVDPRGVYKCRRSCADFGEVCEQ